MKWLVGVQDMNWVVVERKRMEEVGGRGGYL